MKKILFLISILSIACSPEHEKSTARANISVMPTINEKINAKIQNPLQTADVNASARVSLLSQDSKIQNRYQFLTSVDTQKNEIVGRVNVSSNLFVRFALNNENFKRDDFDTFIKKVNEAHSNGEISGVQWAAFVAAEKIYKATGSTMLLNKFETAAINQKVAATFPGVLGGTNPLSKSLSLLWVKKFDAQLNPLVPEIKKTFAASLPLVGYEDMYSDMRSSLASAIQFYPLRADVPELERASSFILFERMFAQLLTLKGYNGAKYVETNGEYSIPPLTDKQKAFDTVLHPGYFIDPKTNQRIVLSPQDIAAYDPAKRILLLSNGSAVASLSTEISMMSAMALAFEASSPAAYFVSGPADYLFGDVLSTKNRAIVPDEAHSLSFGLMAMELQNIGARRIAQVNAQGQDVTQVGGDVAGMVLFDENNGQKIVSLQPILGMIKFYVQLDSAINDVLEKSAAKPDELKAMNNFYQSNAAFDGFAKVQFGLNSMRTGLYLLTMDMVHAKSESATWDPKAGLKFKGDGLSVERKREIGVVLRDLAIHMDQPLILQNANKLLNGEL